MISIGICAYNEQGNIGLLLEWLTKNYRDAEIIVVASGCTDNTVKIAKSYQQVITIEQPQRLGKASAINLFLKNAHGSVMVLVSADTVPDVHCIERLDNMLLNNVGITGCRVKPIGGLHSSVIMWDICHYLSLKHPKIGEIICFKNIVRKINSNTSVDEVAIEAEVIRRGYKSQYVSNATIWNRACGNYKDLIKQRKRIYKGHLQLKAQGYSASSMSIKDVALATIHCIKRGLLRALLIEIYSRIIAYIEYRKGAKEDTIWERCSTTKTLV